MLRSVPAIFLLIIMYIYHIHTVYFLMKKSLQCIFQFNHILHYQNYIEIYSLRFVVILYWNHLLILLNHFNRISPWLYRFKDSYLYYMSPLICRVMILSPIYSLSTLLPLMYSPFLLSLLHHHPLSNQINICQIYSLNEHWFRATFYNFYIYY